MRPSRRLLWLSFGAALLALLAIIAPALPADWALIPLALLLMAALTDWVMTTKPSAIDVMVSNPPEVFVNERATLKLNLEPKHGRLPVNGICGLLEPVEGFVPPGELMFDKGQCVVPLMARKRGVWPLQRIWLFWTSRLGLIDFVPVKYLNRNIAVVPNIRPVVSGQIDFDMRTALFGAKQTSLRGEGSEFHQLNDYVPGMDPRSIDWKHSARQNKMVAKEMRAERNHQIILAMDNGHLMREEIDGVARIDHKISAALALAWAGIQGGDLVGLYAFDAQPRLYIPPQPGRTAFARLRSEMAQLAYRSVETNHTLALATLHERLNRRSLVVVFSDFVDPLAAELLLEHLTILKRHHVVIFVSLHDPVLETIAQDAASTMNDVARAVSATDLLAERRLVFEKMAALGVDVIETSPGRMTPQLVNAYLAIKAQELI